MHSVPSALTVSIGAVWRARWESLTLFTPSRYSSLPGLPFPGEPDGYPNRDEVIAYLEQYAGDVRAGLELDRLQVVLGGERASRIECTAAGEGVNGVERLKTPELPWNG
jgi:putative flavoprotein involved in K+ transport